MRHYVIAGNWKMNKNPAEAAALIAEIKPLVADSLLRCYRRGPLCRPARRPGGQ